MTRRSGPRTQITEDRAIGPPGSLSTATVAPDGKKNEGRCSGRFSASPFFEDKVAQGATVMALNAIWRRRLRFSQVLTKSGPYDALIMLSTAIKI